MRLIPHWQHKRVVGSLCRCGERESRKVQIFDGKNRKEQAQSVWEKYRIFEERKWNRN